MARDNYGDYEAEGNPLVPMESEWGQPDKGPQRLRERLDGYYVDKTHTPSMASGSNASDASRSIPKGYNQVPNQYDPYCNYAGYEGGNTTLISWDEYKIADSTVQAVPVVYAEDCQTIDGQSGLERI
jgi:hypothetical protein